MAQQTFENEENCYQHYDPDRAEERKCWACMQNPYGRGCFIHWQRGQEAIRLQEQTEMPAEERAYFAIVARELTEKMM